MILESTIVEWDEASDVKQMWEYLKQVVVGRVREMCVSIRMGRKEIKRVNGGRMRLKLQLKMKVCTSKDVLEAMEEIMKERGMKIYK